MINNKKNCKHMKKRMHRFKITSMILLIGMMMLLMRVHARDISFQRFDIDYQLDRNVIPTFFYSGNTLHKYFRGYLELHVDEKSELEGSYSINSAGCPYLKSPVLNEQLESQTCFKWDLSRLRLGNTSNNGEGQLEQVTLKFAPQFDLNVDPYSIRAFILKMNPKGGFQYVPAFPQSLDDKPTLGPWQFNVNMTDYLGSYLLFAVFAYDSAIEKLDTTVFVTYPREIYFGDANIQQRMVMIYDSATVLAPSTPDKPTVTISMLSKYTVSLPEDYELYSSYSVKEVDFGKYYLDETRQFAFGSYLFHNKVGIDLHSLKCAYSIPGQSLIVDNTSFVRIDDRGDGTHVLICNQHLTISEYVISIIGKAQQYDNCYDHCTINPTKVVHMETASATYLTFNPNTQLSGTLKPLKFDPSYYANRAVQPTIQYPLTLLEVFGIDFSGTLIDNRIPKTDSNQNLVKVRVEKVLDKVNQDPFSFRLFVLNEEKSLFELACPDTPSIFEEETLLDVEKYMNTTLKRVIFGVFYYNNQVSKIGELTYAHYPRDVTFSLSTDISLELYFRQLYPHYVTYEKRPYFTLNPYNPPEKENTDFNFRVQSFMQQDGNGLENFGFNEGRKFKISYNTRLFSPNGHELLFLFQDLRCAYLFKESNFQRHEFSSAIPVPNDESREYVLDCAEDINDESFVFMLVAKTFHPQKENQLFGQEYVMSREKMGIYSGIEYKGMLRKDLISIRFNPNSLSTGKYRISLDKRIYSNYKLPVLEKLSLISVFELDFSGITFNETSILSKQVTIGYQTVINETEVNFDPFSYNFFWVNEEKQEFNLIGNNEKFVGNWETSIDMSTLNGGKVKIGVFVFDSNQGQLGKTYSLTYARSLIYEVDINEQVTISISSPSFPDSSSNSQFQLVSQDSSKNQPDGYVNVKSFTISQSIKADIFTSRSYTFDHKLLDHNENKVSDLSSLQCLYVLPNLPTPIFGHGKITNTTVEHNGLSTPIYTLECLEIIGVQQYDWIIIAKSKEVPPGPTPPVQPSVEKSSQGGDGKYNAIQNAVTVMGVLIAVLVIVIIVLIVMLLSYIVYNRKKDSTRRGIFAGEEMKEYYSMK